MTSRSKQKHTRKSKTKKCQYLMKHDDDIIHNLPKAFMILLVVVIIASFVCGCIVRIYIISSGFAAVFDMPIRGRTLLLMSDECSTRTTQTNDITESLSLPKLPSRKEAPTFTYSSKTFPPIMVAVATSSTVLLHRGSAYPFMHPMTRKNNNLADTSNNIDVVNFNVSPTRTTMKPMTIKTFRKSKRSNIGNTVHHPSGQHLLVDIKNVDANFLNSEKRLSHAIVELAKVSKATLLSYHCHSLVPIGVSCVGVLVESHIALHTWPLEGVISLDIYTCGNRKLMPVIPSIELLFGIKQALNSSESLAPQDAPAMLWSHKLRGFRDYSWNSLENDLGIDFSSKRFIELKRTLVSRKTKFQQVDVVELLDPRYDSMTQYQKSRSNDSSYESSHPDFYSPNIMVYLDGQIQSSIKGEQAYHEALVHPAMITHPNPKRVAIIGGGEGATLREVLKHDTVEKALMLEIDGEEVELLRKFIPEWSDCSDFSENDRSCYDDPRTELLITDAIKWFIDNFGERRSDANDGARREHFDVIIMDALDPNDNIEFASGLYDSSSFELSLMNALSEDGILVAQLGRSPMHREAADEFGPFAARASMINTLQQVGFESLHVYDEAHSEFDAPWSYLVALKDKKMRANWYRSAPELDIELRRRISRTRSGDSALKRFDAPTMVEYQVPSKTFETNYCRQSAFHPECEDRFNVCKTTITKEQLQVHQSLIGKSAGRGLFAAVDIPMQSCLLIPDGSKSFQVLPSTCSVIDDLLETSIYTNSAIAGVQRDLSALFTFITGYGYVSSLLGTQHWSIDSNVLVFMNHGCNKTYNYATGWGSCITEVSVNPTCIPPQYDNDAEIYSPVIERHLRTYISGPFDYTLRDIKAEEELLANYLEFVANEDSWKEDVLSLRRQCEGKTLGEISEYENKHG